MKIKSVNKVYLIFVLLLGINLLLGAFNLLYLGRPIVYYEYLLIPLLFSFSGSYYYRVIVLLVLVFSDLLISISKIYYFDTFNFLQKFSSIFISNFSLKIWLVVIASALLIFSLIHLIIKKTIVASIAPTKKDKKFGLIFFVISFSIIFLFDSLFGSSSLQFKPNGKFNANISQSIIRQYIKDARVYFKKYLLVSKIENFKNIDNKNSITYQYLLNDSSSKQSLIILESWGLHNNLQKRMEQIKPILMLSNHGYTVHLDSSLFFGGTSQAEARELFNKSGEAYYSIIQHGFSDINCIAQQKKEAGYNTISLQSFSGFYSSGYHFRKAAGFNSIKDFSFFRQLAPTNYNNHYISVNDEAVFDYGFKQLIKQNKAFLYILTINTHLPFYTQTGISELESQYQRIKQQFSFLANLLKIYPVDKLIIVGDHPPPFLTESERSYYSFKFVPALIIEKKAK
jgi:hypothetical protein